MDGTAAADYLLRTAGAGMLGGLALPLQPHAAPVETGYEDHRLLPQESHGRRPDKILHQAGFIEGVHDRFLRRLVPLQAR